MNPMSERALYPRFDVETSEPLPPQPSGYYEPYDGRFDQPYGGRYPARQERILMPTEPVSQSFPTHPHPQQRIPPAPVKLFSGRDVVALIFAVLIPPVGVLMMRGFLADFWINLVLTILGYIPGQIHAVWIVLRYRLGKRGYVGEFPAHRQRVPMEEGNPYSAPYTGV